MFLNLYFLDILKFLEEATPPTRKNWVKTTFANFCPADNFCQLTVLKPFFATSIAQKLVLPKACRHLFPNLNAKAALSNFERTALSHILKRADNFFQLYAYG